MTECRIPMFHSSCKSYAIDILETSGTKLMISHFGKKNDMGKSNMIDDLFPYIILSNVIEKECG